MATPRDYDRYELVRNNDGTIDQMPFIPIPNGTSDKYITWNDSKDRMDKLSQRYYGSPFFDWLIMYANPEYISEFDIPNGAIIRVPFPLSTALNDYQAVLSSIRTQ